MFSSFFSHLNYLTGEHLCNLASCPLKWFQSLVFDGTVARQCKDKKQKMKDTGHS